jgi:hypothetical protein
VKPRFDRGTILLTEPPRELNLGEAPGVLWDSRVGAHRAPARRYVELTSWLYGAEVELEDIAPTPRPIADARSAADLRPYQEAALAARELAHRRERKPARYRSARLPNLILCIDEERNCASADLPASARVVRFRRRVDPAAVLRLVDG